MSGSANIAAALAARAAERPDAAALILVDGRRVTFRELDADSGRIAAGFAALGVGPGTRTALLVPPGPDFFPLVFGLFKAGAVPVVVDPGMGLDRMAACLAEARPEAFVGIWRAHLARRLRGLGGPGVRVAVRVGGGLGFGGTTLEDVRRLGAAGAAAYAARPEDPAAILYTSGSTGAPKGALYTHGNFAAQVEMVRTTFGIEPGEIDLPTFPLFALFDPALGMTTVVPDMDPRWPAEADPRRIADAIRTHGVTTMFASPGLLRPFAEFHRGAPDPFPTLRRVITAGAPVAPRIVQDMAALLPEGALLHTPYGATEALPVATIDHREILGETAAAAAAGKGICVGRPVAGVEVRCIRVEDGPIAAWSADFEVAAGTPGEICVRGPQVTTAYFGRPDADAAAKIPDPAGGAWHRMGDVGYVDPAGRLWFLGRKSQRVRTAAGDLYADQWEAVFNVHPEVERTALVGVGPPGDQRAYLWVELHCGEPYPDLGKWTQEHAVLLDDVLSELPALPADLAARIREVATRKGPFLLPLRHCSLPVDTRHNAKIQREALAARAARKPRGDY